MKSEMNNRNKKRSQTSEIWHRLRKNHLAILGMAILLCIFLLAIFAE